MSEFGGETYDPALDRERLTQQLSRVRGYLLAAAGSWVSLQDCPVAKPNEGTAALTARARDLRKKKFGGYAVECRRRPGTAKGSLYEYRIPWLDGKPQRIDFPSRRPVPTPDKKELELFLKELFERFEWCRSTGGPPVTDNICKVVRWLEKKT
jgi:hypothetical protein